MTLHEKIYELYLLEKQVHGLESRMDASSRRHRIQDGKLAQLTQQHTELEEQVKQARVAAATLESEIQTLEEKIEKGRQEMNLVKTNKEYSALLVEINTYKDDKSKIEDEALAVMSKVEDKEAERDAIADQVTAQEKMVAIALKEVEQAKTEVGDQLDKLKADRDAAAANVPDKARDLFSHASHLNDGDAVAAIVEENRKHMEYSCGGCYMNIPAERVSTVMSKPDEVTTCPNCGRILFMEAELKSELAR